MNSESPLLSEKTLVERARRGDPAAFGRILDRHQKRVLRVALSILGNPMDAEEVSQDVFMTVFDKIDHFREDASFSTWLHRITTNAALVKKRRDRSRMALLVGRLLGSSDTEEYIAAGAQGRIVQDDPALEAERRKVIQEAIERLDHKYQSVFLLREIERFSTDETAHILGVETATVKTRLHRARLFLRKELAGYFERQIHLHRGKTGPAKP